jgi:hypothetical protein
LRHSFQLNNSAANRAVDRRDAEFTALAKVISVGKKACDNQTMVMRFAVSGRKMRNEMDMTKMGNVSPRDLAGMKQMGMDQMVILVLPKKSASYMVFPNPKSYCDMPASGKGNPEGKLEKKPHWEATPSRSTPARNRS